MANEGALGLQARGGALVLAIGRHVESITPMQRILHDGDVGAGDIRGAQPPQYAHR